MSERVPRPECSSRMLPGGRGGRSGRGRCLAGEGGGERAARAEEGGASGAQAPGCQAIVRAGLPLGEAAVRRP